MYSKILVPIDGSHTGKLGLQEAIRLAASQKSPASLRLVHVIDDFPMLVEMSSVISFDRAMQALRHSGQAMLEQARQLAVASDIQADVAIRESTGARVANEVLAEARESGCDLIVMGTHGRRGLTRLALGSDADMIVGASHIPVLLVRGQDAPDDSEGVPK
jgi:nucleotide-binding universal stress UspA family protein